MIVNHSQTLLHRTFFRAVAFLLLLLLVVIRVKHGSKAELWLIFLLKDD